MWLIHAWLNGEIESSPHYAEILYSCVACANCQEQCVYQFKDNLLDILQAAKAELVSEGLIPPTVRDYFKAISVNGNPYKRPPEERGKWAEGTGIQEFSDHEFLFYVGCVGSHDESGVKMARSVGTLLSEAGVSLGILGNQETCDGNEVRVLGETGLFSLLAEDNIRRFNEKGVKNIITLDPHAYNAFTKEYPKVGGDFEVRHYTEILAMLIKEKKIVPSEYRVKVTYHDPCYLGRHHRIYDPPRKILKSIPGLELAEMRRNRENAFCCGGGGGNFFTDIIGAGEDCPNRIRMREALATGAEILAVACPNCAKMLTDAIKMEDQEDNLEIMDISAIVWMTQPK
jgi:Fe-S oxidoreductase